MGIGEIAKLVLNETIFADPSFQFGFLVPKEAVMAWYPSSQIHNNIQTSVSGIYSNVIACIVLHFLNNKHH